MLDDIGYQVLQALARMMARAEIMHVAKGALDEVGPGALSRQEE
jgi:hypothetical protein